MTSPQPVALSTTKRKFHKLLDNLNANKSTPNLASSFRSANTSTTSLAVPTTTEPPSKRSRHSDVSMISRMSMDKPRPHASPSTIRSVKSKTTASTPPRKTPNYAPYSQDAFLARLKTFADVKLWTMKPDPINEVQWVKRGWVCEAWNTVACKGGCEARVVVSLRPKRKDEKGEEIEGSEDWSVDVEEELVAAYAERIVEGHAEFCLWRRAGCKKDIYHIPIARRDVCEADLSRRYQSLKAIEPHLPPFECVKFTGIDPASLIKCLPPSFFAAAEENAATEETPPPSLTAFAFALFGWNGVAQDGLYIAQCSHCFQRVGLWLYTKERIATMAKKVNAEESQLLLNLLETHREHCPWKNVEAQANPPDGQVAGFAAWRTLQYVLGVNKRRDTTATQGSAEVGGEADVVGKKDGAEKGDEDLAGRWQRLKSKLKRSTSKRSLKSLGKGGDS
ncbi:zf-C3HC-domain-containing protein [Lophium mytilinum]|uniref:Zf-C3HC-domain-containing protein n=1 Tax=Lophium mytilinum TaxID=390894 RepID=A0A6A6QQU2_9PEZI|nr:zf-C3HC-domain-containing protein [Lophium mytilinum]